MEAFSSNSSNSNSTPKTWKYDIFLSFRGEDTRRGFTDHLYHALKRSGFRVFRDDEELPRGEIISEELKQAIENSNFAIVILSKNYASSSWCLDELQHVLYSKDNLYQQVFPIFYDVDPSDVRFQRGSFDEAFKGHQHKFPEDPQKVQKWRDFLTKVANLSGFDSRQYRYETQLIDRVVDRLRVQLHSKLTHVNVSEAPIGIEWRVNKMLSLLGMGLDDVRFIGIWGMSGVGKTTLARAIYERFHNQFDFYYFLANIRELSERYDLLYLQNKLLSHLNIKNIKIEDINEGKNTLGCIFRNKKVMLILDDVNHTSQLENLVGSPEWFGDGSRIIITTRDLHLLRSHQVDETYEVQPMDNNESLQLFCQKAFRGRGLPHNGKEQFQQLSLSLVNYTRGLPLALCVLGSFFCGRGDLTEWKDALDMLREDSDNDIFKTLRISYNELTYAEKHIFLYIACFFNMWGKDEITQILESCGLPVRAGLHTLREKSLLAEVEIGNYKYIDMHDLVQDMGRLIVIQESPVNVGRRSKLWLPDEIDQLLERDMGTEAIEAVVLPHTFEKNEVHWNPEAFLKMCWLRLLIISCNLDLLLHLKGLPGTLKVLHWYGYPFTTLPSKENMDQLVYLKMQNSKIKRLSNENDRQSMKNLQILDLSHSKYLVQTPNFFEFQNLKRLILEGCTSLVEIDSSIGQLHFLVEVNLKGCLNLKVLPKKLEMKSLELFVLSGCTQVRQLPEFGKRMEKLRTLDVKKTRIVTLPKSFGLLTSLETLKLRGCKTLIGLPQSIHKLKRLVYMDISRCSRFHRLPKNLNEMEALEEIDATETDITEVPFSISGLKKIKKLSFPRCRRLTSNSWSFILVLSLMISRHPRALSDSIFNLKSLKELNLSYCGIVDGSIPDSFSGLSSLEKLNLSGNLFKKLHTGCISNLLKLRVLYLNSCSELRSLPQLGPNVYAADARECGSLEAMSDEQLSHLFTSIDQGERLIVGDSLDVTIPGSEIPSWFKNQNDLFLNHSGEAWMMIDMPPCGEEVLGIGLCIVIDDKFFSTEPKKRPPFGLLNFWLNIATIPHPPNFQPKTYARVCGYQEDMKSSHLWIMFWKQEKELSRCLQLSEYSHIPLKFSADPCWKKDSKDWKVEAKDWKIKCGWRVIRKGDFENWDYSMSQSLLPAAEKHNDQENTISSGEEHGECNLLQGGASRTIIRECETSLDEGIREDEVELDESWKQFIADDSRFWF